MDEKAKRFLRATALRVLFEYIRQRNRSRPLDDEYAEKLKGVSAQTRRPTEPPPANDGLIREERRREIRDLLATRPEIEREIIYRRAYGQESFAQIAGHLGMSRDAVSKRHQRALHGLEQICRERGLFDDGLLMTSKHDFRLYLSLRYLQATGEADLGTMAEIWKQGAEDPHLAEILDALDDEIELDPETGLIATPKPGESKGKSPGRLEIPNLFSFAPSELSQDAFICWLASWADPALKAVDGHLHATAVSFVNRLLEVGNGPLVPQIRSIEVRPKWNNIDVLVVVNTDVAVVIEDKTVTEDHSDQLVRYKEVAGQVFGSAKVAVVYLKTEDQACYRRPTDAGYGCFRRGDFLAILDAGKQAGVRNDIYGDFHRRLQLREDRIQRYSKAALSEWDADCWVGFFLALQ